MVAQLLRRLSRAPGCVLHPVRRRRAVASLLARQRPARLLVVCNGNIFRSPFAAAVLRRRLDPWGVQVESAGFLGANRPAPPDARAAAAKRGVDLSPHRSRMVTAELAHGADLIVVMDTVQRRAICERFGRLPRDVVLLGDLDPEPLAARTIEDPVEQGVDVCSAVYARIDRCVMELVSVLARLRSGR